MSGLRTTREAGARATDLCEHRLVGRCPLFIPLQVRHTSSIHLTRLWQVANPNEAYANINAKRKAGKAA